MLVAAMPGVRHWKIETLLFWPGGPRSGRALECLPGLKTLRRIYGGGNRAVDFWADRWDDLREPLSLPLTQVAVETPCKRCG